MKASSKAQVCRRVSVNHSTSTFIITSKAGLNYKISGLRNGCVKLREIDFLLKNLQIDSTASPLLRLITWNLIHCINFCIHIPEVVILSCNKL